MPAKNLQRIDKEGLFLHIYNKGTARGAIFNDEEDYKVFLSYLSEYLTAPKDPKSIKKTFQVHGRTFIGTPHLPKNYFNEVELTAYSLMPDRFHLIVHQKTRGSIERFLRSLSTRYSMYFNKKYERNGALFEGPYKSVQIKDEVQLSRLTAFIHHSGNNSSYPEYLGFKKTSWVNPQVVLSLFKNGPSDYKNFVEKALLDGITFDDNGDQLGRSPEGRNVTSKPDLPTDADLKVGSRMPQFLAVSGVGFVFLVSFSLWNIHVSSAKINPPASTPAVLSETKEVTPSPTPDITSQDILEATATAIPEATAAAKFGRYIIKENAD